MNYNKVVEDLTELYQLFQSYRNTVDDTEKISLEAKLDQVSEKIVRQFGLESCRSTLRVLEKFVMLNKLTIESLDQAIYCLKVIAIEYLSNSTLELFDY